MVVGSLFCLSLGLSVLVEVVRMLNLGKKGKPAKGAARAASPAGLPFGASALRTKRRQRCWGLLGFHQRDMVRLSGQVGRFGSLGAPIGAPKARQKWT
jgi:hypothetical protein